MSPKEALQSFVYHVALASVVWLLFALILEFVIPGFVTPFVDVVDLAGLAVVIIPFGLIAARKDASSRVRFFSLIVSLLLAAIGLFFLWFSFAGEGTLHKGLWVAAFVSSIGAAYAIYA